MLLVCRQNGRNPLPSVHGPVSHEVFRKVIKLIARDIGAPLVKLRQPFEFHILQVSKHFGNRCRAACRQLLERSRLLVRGLTLSQPGRQQRQDQADRDSEHGLQPPHPTRRTSCVSEASIEQERTDKGDNDQRERGQPDRQHGLIGHGPFPIASVDVHAQHGDECTGPRIG